MEKTLIVYYSYTGNTRLVANEIKRRLDADILEIQPVFAYSSDYDKVVKDEEEKMNDNEIIEIRDININLDDYDRIIIGTPVWWYTMAPAIRSFFNKYNLNNKEIKIFVTNGGWLGHTIKDFEKYITFDNYINIKFNGSNLVAPFTEIEKWIDNLTM